MEADWEIEIGPDAPVIEPHWAGFLDLACVPERAYEMPETRSQPGLAEALIRLNSGASVFWTSKCDVFDPGQVDPSELDASPEQAVQARSCYIDVLTRDQAWNSVRQAERACGKVCRDLRSSPLRCCRVDLVVRRAIFPASETLGLTAYLTGCGPDAAQAKARLTECLSAFAMVMVPAA